MAIRLVTGVPGAGKTLFAVSQIAVPMSSAVIELESGGVLARRLCVGGVSDLLVPHEPIEVPRLDQEHMQLTNGATSWAPVSDDRRPGAAPVADVEMRADNWWLWCKPGDVIVIDECQKLFRPLAAGKRAPMYVSQLEVHRHYGVDFVLITQHPQLIHASVRNLVGRHNHVRRVFGGSTTIVYEWDQCSDPTKIGQGTKRVWRHDKKAYALYKSAELHTHSGMRLPLAVPALILAVLAIPALAYVAKERIERERDVTLEAAKQAKVEAHKAEVQHAKAAASAASGAGSGSFDGGPSVAEKASRALGALGGAVATVVEKVAEPELLGCLALARRCECFSEGGKRVSLSLDECTHETRTLASRVKLAFPPGVPWVPAATVEAQRVEPVALGGGEGRLRLRREN